MLAEQIKATAALCESAAARCPRPVRTLPQAPRIPSEWFELLHGFPETGAAAAQLRRLTDDAAIGEVERYALLQALREALRRLPALAADDSVKWLFCATCAQVADAEPDPCFALDSQTFYQIAHVATLRWLPAGELCLEVTALPRAWLLRIAPLDLPKVVAELWRGFGGLGPTVTTHLWSWRANPFLILKSEHERALWRVAETIRRRSDIRGVMIDGWMHSREAGQAFPHLAWVRGFFVEQGAILADMGPAPPTSGFLTGSAKRRRLYQDGTFRPRRALVLWRRDALLAWADRRPDLAAESRIDGLPPIPAKLPQAAAAVEPWRDRWPRLHVVATIVAPALLVTVLVATWAAWWTVLPAFLLAALTLWLLRTTVLSR